jgi:cephalosporin-C deacetylase-like acetyl esterase
MQNKLVVKEENDFKQFWNKILNLSEKYQTKPIHSIEEIIKLKQYFQIISSSLMFIITTLL